MSITEEVRVCYPVRMIGDSTIKLVYRELNRQFVVAAWIDSF